MWYVCFSFDDERIPVDPNYVRGELWVGCNVKESASMPHASEVRYIVFTDIKEPSIPKFLLNRGIFDEISLILQKMYYILPRTNTPTIKAKPSPQLQPSSEITPQVPVSILNFFFSSHFETVNFHRS